MFASGVFGIKATTSLSSLKAKKLVQGRAVILCEPRLKASQKGFRVQEPRALEP